jgi:hypothetical protein
MLKLNNMLNFLAKLIYLKFKPKIIVVSGTSGKTTTIEIIKRFLSNRKNIFSVEYHKDHKLSIPLTFLLEKDYKLLKNILKGLKILFFTKNYPEYILRFIFYTLYLWNFYRNYYKIWKKENIFKKLIWKRNYLFMFS